MSKKVVTYRELLSKVSAELKKVSDAAGEKFDIKKVGKAASVRWAKVKAGQDNEFSAPEKGASAPIKSKKAKKPKKGKKSSHDDESEHDTKKYVHHHMISAQDILDNVDLSEEAREKIKAFIASSKTKYCKTVKKGKKSKRHRKKRKTKKAKSI
jgi:hypothetical protein